MKKLLITGCNGFIGNAAKKYFERTYDIYGIDMAGYGDKRTYIMDMNSDSIREYISMVHPDIILHAAGGANVSKSVENPIEDFKNSVQIFYSLLENIRDVNRRCIVLFLSSAAVYGNVNINMLPISETTNLKPISPYGLHKMICENIAEYYRDAYNMDIRVLRIFSVYGPGLRKQVLWDMFQKYIKNGEIELYGTGDEARDFIYIEDLLKSLDIIMNAAINKGQYIFNVANGEAVTIKELSHVFSMLLCGEDKVKFNKIGRSCDPDVWRADVSRIREMGYCKSISLEQGIMNYIKWAEKENVFR